MADEIAKRNLDRKDWCATGLIDRKFEMRDMACRLSVLIVRAGRCLSRANAGEISPQHLSWIEP
jgi:hypothetical protein